MDDMQKNNSSNISDDNYYNNDKHKDNRSPAKNDSSKSSVQKGRNRTDSFQKKKEELIAPLSPNPKGVKYS